jgi:arginine decarboxylase
MGMASHPNFAKGLLHQEQALPDETSLSDSGQLIDESAQKAFPPLAQALYDYNALGRQRFHVPAHAGYGEHVGGATFLAEPYRYDLTEVDGLDVLSDPEGCLAESQAGLAKLFNVAHTFLLVNGATVGLLAALLACLQPGDAVLLPRNVHRSVLSGLILTGAQPIWFLPERLAEWGLWGSVSPALVAEHLDQNSEIKALILTSPTYEGIGSDIAALSVLCRERKVLLIVDEAHGSLWPLNGHLPMSATHAGADCVVHSIHKSAGCLTQGALAHLPHGSRISQSAFQQALNLVQTTSPSYLLMASIEACCYFWASDAGQIRLTTWLDAIIDLREKLPPLLKALCLFTPVKESGISCDPSKLYWIHPRISGETWGGLFEEELALAYEAASPYGVLYQANPALEASDFARFVSSLCEGERLLANRFPEKTNESLNNQEFKPIFSCQASLEVQNPATLLPEIVFSPREAYFSPSENVSPKLAIGRIAHKVLVRCPPGIPILMPGERIQPSHLPFLPPEGFRVLR